MAERWHTASKHLDHIPFWIESLDGVAGHVGGDLEDFRVEEVPAYEPCGFGDHTMALVEKRGMSTPEAVRVLAEAVGVRPSDVGYAGLKDSWAVTTQYLSVPDRSPERLLKVRRPGLKVLAARRHKNKLQIGHLKGNRFPIRIVTQDPDAAEKCRVLLDHLARTGLPNIFGPQRFGNRDRNLHNGLRILSGQARMGNPRHAKFLASAVQAALFKPVPRPAHGA